MLTLGDTNKKQWLIATVLKESTSIIIYSIIKLPLAIKLLRIANSAAAS
jgi:hypothetical protein